MTLLRDIRFGLRLLKRNLGFSSVAVLTLALGVAATTAIFSVVYGTFFAPLPYREADRLVMVWEQEHGQRRPVSGQSYVDWKRGATSFAAINAWGGGSYNLSTDDRPESVTAGQATPGFLEMLGYGYPLTLGRTFVEEEGIPGRDKVVVLTYQLWKERFGGDVGIVGRQVRIDGLPYTVVGVLGQVLREGMLTAGVGTAAGAIGAALVGRALSGAVFGIESSSPLTFVAVALVLLAAAFLACLVPARRAASVDPMVALRQD